jgi:hypothetical protein
MLAVLAGFKYSKLTCETKWTPAPPQKKKMLTHLYTTQQISLLYACAGKNRVFYATLSVDFFLLDAVLHFYKNKPALILLTRLPKRKILPFCTFF